MDTGCDHFAARVMIVGQHCETCTGESTVLSNIHSC